jgi:uncharacterized protein
MKIPFAVTVLICVASPFATSLRAQQTVPSPPQATSAPVPGANAGAIDPEKEADIRKLLELSNTKAMFNQTIGTMMSLIQKSLLQSNPDDPKAQMLANLIAQELRGDMTSQYDDLVSHLIPVYDKYYTKDDIEKIIQFYGTPIGQKLLKVTPDLTRELQTIGYQWGSKIGRDAFAKVLQTHPDLRGLSAMSSKQ